MEGGIEDDVEAAEEDDDDGPSERGSRANVDAIEARFRAERAAAAEAAAAAAAAKADQRSASEITTPTSFLSARRSEACPRVCRDGDSVRDDSVSKKVAAQGISFPGPLVVMFALIFALLALDALAKDEKSSFSARCVISFRRWIGLPAGCRVYVPSLVTLPLVVSTMEAATLGKIVGLLVAVVVEVAFSAKLATSVRQMTGVEMQPLPQKRKPPTTDLVKQLVGFTTMMSYLSASWLPPRRTNRLSRWVSWRDGIFVVNR